MGRGVWVGCIREGLVGVWWGVWGVRGVLCVGCMGIGGKAWGLREGVELYGGVIVWGWGGEAGVSEGGAVTLGVDVVGAGEAGVSGGGAVTLGVGVVGVGLNPGGGWWLGGWVCVLGLVVWVGGSVWGGGRGVI